MSTKNVHSDRHFGVEHGGIHKPIHSSVQYGFEQVEDLIAVFQGTRKGGFYRCNACLGTGTVISRERLKALKDTDWFTPQFDSPVSDEEDAP